MVTVARALAAAVLFVGFGLPPATWSFSPTCVPVCHTHTVTWTARCGMPTGLTKTPFTLAFEAPLPAPVMRYPLQCDQFGICS